MLGDRHKLTPKVRKRQSISQFKIGKELLARIVGLGERTVLPSPNPKELPWMPLSCMAAGL